MGHTPFKFETMLMTLACGPKGPGILGGPAPKLKTISGQPKEMELQTPALSKDSVKEILKELVSAVDKLYLKYDGTRNNDVLNAIEKAKSLLKTPESAG